MVKIFRIEGMFKKKGQKMSFTKEVPAGSKDRAIEKVYSTLGSKHAVKRSLINIDNTNEIEPEDAENPEIRALSEE